MQKGFTIVELLIVIVIIGVLVALTLVTYNGLQQRGTNSAMTSAVGSYAKAIMNYKNVVGSFPQSPGCIGGGYGNGFSGSEPTNVNGQCQSWNAIKENTTLNNQIRPYLNNTLPSPPTGTIGDSGVWFRGIHYNNYGPFGGYYLGFVIVGNNSCPSVSGLVSPATTNLLSGGRYCLMAFSEQT